MSSGWNRRYLAHWLSCKQTFLAPSVTRGLAVIVSALILGIPGSGKSVPSDQQSGRPVQEPDCAIQETWVPLAVIPIAPEVTSMSDFLGRHQVAEINRLRLAESVVASAAKHDLDPKLLASIMIVESRGNPFAISGVGSVGLMQIHLPTWGETADREEINLLKIEDNVDLGARILKGYVRRFGLWEGVKRYNGFIPGEAVWEESAQRYLVKVQGVYENRDEATAG
jgi:hypothetical protein